LSSTLGFLPGGPDRWVSDCTDEDSGHSFYYRVDTPVQAPATFDYALDSERFVGADVIVWVDKEGGDVRSDHLTEGRVAGWIERDPMTEDDIITGTFRATWGTPTQNCRADLPDRCAAADVHGTYRVIYSIKPDDFP
jgi:hypothetical protein